MAWTYDFTDFLNTNAGTYPGSFEGVRYQIRFLIQDTNTNRQLFQDEEIDFQQTLEMNPWTMAAALCDILVAKAGSIKQKKVEDLSITYDPEFYRQLAGQLRARGSNYQIPYAGGISVADKLAQQLDTDWVQPAISRGLDNNPQAPGPANPPVNSISSNPLASS
jgi:hypothetical protein